MPFMPKIFAGAAAIAMSAASSALADELPENKFRDDKIGIIADIFEQVNEHEKKNAQLDLDHFCKTSVFKDCLDHDEEGWITMRTHKPVLKDMKVVTIDPETALDEYNASDKKKEDSFEIHKEKNPDTHAETFFSSFIAYSKYMLIMQKHEIEYPGTKYEFDKSARTLCAARADDPKFLKCISEGEFNPDDPMVQRLKRVLTQIEENKARLTP